MNVSKEININLNSNIWKTDFKNTVLTYDIELIITHKLSWLKLFKPSFGSKDKNLSRLTSVKEITNKIAGIGKKLSR